MKNRLIIIMLISLLLITGCYTGMPVTSPVPEENRGQVLVNIEYPENITNELRCDIGINLETNPYGPNLKFSENIIIPFPLIETSSKGTETIIDRGIAYRFRMEYLHMNIPRSLKIFEMAQNISNLKLDNKWKIVCETELFNNDVVIAHIWDEGFEEVKEIHLPKTIMICSPDEIYCELIYHSEYRDQVIPSYLLKEIREEVMR